MSVKDMADYLPGTAIADYVGSVMDIPSQEVIGEPGRFPGQKRHVTDGSTYLTTTPNTQQVFEVSLKFKNKRDSDVGTLLDFFHDTAKGMGMARSFIWQHPTDGNQYIVKFKERILERLIKFVGVQGFSGFDLLVIDVATVQATLTGTVTVTTNETDIVAGGKTVILTLVNAQWDATVGADNAITTALINGITSAESEGTGWNAEVRDNMTFAEVTRTSDTIVTIILAAEAAYDITADETITATIPATAISTGVVAVATPTFGVLSTARDLSAFTWNPADKSVSLGLSNGNLTATVGTGVKAGVRATGSFLSGKFYFEITTGGTDTSASEGRVIGVMDSTHPLDQNVGFTALGWGFSEDGGGSEARKKNNNNIEQAGAPKWDTGIVVRVAGDVDAGKIWWGTQGTWHNSGDPVAGTNPAYSNLSGTLFPAFSSFHNSGTIIITVNFGASPWADTPPTGFAP